MKYLNLVLFLVLFGCKEESSPSLIGKWKLLGPENVETNVDIDFSKDQYVLRSLNDNTTTTYDYKWEGNNIISKKVGSSESDTMLFNFIHKDSIIVTTPNGVYSTLIRYGN